MISGWKALDTSWVWAFNPLYPNDSILEISLIEYNEENQLVSKKTTVDSKGDSIKTVYRYTVDETTEPYLRMVDTFHMLSYPTEIELYKNSDFLESNLISYKYWDSDSSAFAPEYFKYKQGSYEYNKMQFHDYDDRLNPLSVSKTNDIQESFIWGYNQSLPIASIINADNKETYHENFEDTSYVQNNSHTGEYHTELANNEYCGVVNFAMSDLISDKYTYSAWIKTSGNAYLIVKDYQDQDPWINVSSGNTNSDWKYIEVEIDITEPEFTGCQTIRCEIWNNSASTVYVDDVRFIPIDAQMSTYTYEPSIGITSQTDTNGQTLYYEYDDLGRLERIKDSQGRVIQNTVYHYATQ
jgi:YD repeat-containing protein